MGSAWKERRNFRRMIHELRGAQHPAHRGGAMAFADHWRDAREIRGAPARMKMIDADDARLRSRFACRRFPRFHSMEWNGNMLLAAGKPRAGIDAEDVSGQLGNIFRRTRWRRDTRSRCELRFAGGKSGVKAGDVITSLNGRRIRTVGELAGETVAKRDEKDRQ